MLLLGPSSSFYKWVVPSEPASLTSRDNHSHLVGPIHWDTHHCQYAVTSHWLPSLILCLLMRWTAETARHAEESTVLPSVTKELPVPWFTANWPSNTSGVLLSNKQCTQMLGHRRRQLPCPNAVNITFTAHATCWLLQFDHNFKYTQYSTRRG